jgi:hypothetical protein
MQIPVNVVSLQMLDSVPEEKRDAMWSSARWLIKEGYPVGPKMAQLFYDHISKLLA